MGLCTSWHTTTAATTTTTAKLILPDGRLQQFLHPTKVSDALHHHPSTFICNADEMDFDDVLSPMKDHQYLHPGQLYFALPLKRLNHPLQPEDMAALAVKASAALAKCGGGRRRNNICFASCDYQKRKSSSKVTDVGTVGLTRRSSGGGKSQRRQFKVMLSAIPE